MAKVVSMRMFDEASKQNTTRNFVEVFCFGDKRSYFKRLTKEQIDNDGSTIRVTQPDKHFEVKVMGDGWSTISKSRFERFLNKINKEREEKGWPAVDMPLPVTSTKAVDTDNKEQQ
jgi:hypothetical protein